MMQRAISSKSILFTEDSVQILSKNPAEQPKKYTLQEINSITLPASIKIPDESLGDVAKTLSGQQTKQYIIIEQATGKIKFDFLVNSYYMLAQLEKVVTLWENAGKKIQRV
jgi:hypothetical protein